MKDMKDKKMDVSGSKKPKMSASKGDKTGLKTPMGQKGK